ncbi:MAG: alanine:cation symporter family protein [Muribaculaceae bacterium]|nr:alanine:cation symporter family protein [Muribaculaceae bacterium]
MNLDSQIDSFLSPIANKISGLIFSHVTILGVRVEFLIVLLMAAALYFTFRTRFIGFWGFRHSIDLITKNYKHDDIIKKKKHGEVSSFQALTATISASAGMGNVVGSALAVSVGGPGVIFWMMIAGVFSMALKFAEVLLGIKFRQINKDGSSSGGPMYYIINGLRAPWIKPFAPYLAKIYAICCVFAMIGGWNLFQINAITTQISNVTGLFAGQRWVFGLIVAVITYITVIGGIKSIGKFTSKVTPVMCSLYVFSAFVICLLNIHHVPHTIGLILHEAFKPSAVGGGVFACMLWGFRRAMFANEAGLGTAPIAFSAVKTSKPVAQAFIAMLQPFVDTMIVGASTAFIIVVTGAYLNTTGIEGIELTSKAFATVCPFFPILLTFMASCFVLSTMLCGSYYGTKSWTFLFGESKLTTRTFQIIYCLFIVIGSAMNLKSVVNLSDAFTLFLAVPNLIAVFLLSDIIIKELKRYCKKYNVGLLRNQD